MSRLKVPGAGLYYEVSGSGPVLLLIAGGTDDARDFTGVVPLLEDAYTVVVYDCRGVSRSSLDGPPRDVPIETHADDAHRLLLAIGDEPAYVFGTSSGAQIGLALAALHPDRVRALVAHEPPAVGLLPAADPRRALIPEVHDLYRRHGVGAAMRHFITGTGMRKIKHPSRHVPESPEAVVQTQERLVRMERNLDFFLAHIVLPAATYLPDTDVLRSAPPRVIAAVGDASEGQLANDTALALAQRLRTNAVLFPGGHAGFVTHPTAFAKRLRETLQSVP